MDIRRAPIVAGGEPRIRQVGFFTPGDSAEPPREHMPQTVVPVAAVGSPPTSDLGMSANSLSPVMIPPPVIGSTDPRLLMGSTVLIEAGYDPSDPIFAASAPSASSPTSARLETGSEFSEEDPTWIRGAGPAVSAVTKSEPRIGVPIAKTLSNLLGDLDETHTEGHASLVSQKQKTTKAERRAIQEAQRAAKAAAKEAGSSAQSAVKSAAAASTSSKPIKPVKGPPQKKDGPVITTNVPEKRTDRTPDRERKKDVPHPRMQFDDEHRVEKAKKRAVVSQYEPRNRVELFRHLPQYVRGTQLPDLESKFFQLEPLHPSVYKVGLQYLSGEIYGGNARCIAMLVAFGEAITDYSTPPEKTLNRDLAAKISSYVSFLTECRPLSISMGNAIRFLKNRIGTLPANLSELDAKSSLLSDIDRFINEKIVLADKVIVDHAASKIKDGDVLLTYGSSSVVEMILNHAYEQGKQFRVVVVDSRPKLEGQRLLHRLVLKGVDCTYTHINAISYIMHEVTKVFLGASSVLSNGTVYGRVGTATVAMVANAFRVPVLVCCEAYKFHERVQLDSICSNELGDPDAISTVPGREDVNYLKNWADNENLQLLSLLYDATPSDYVSIIITDYGMLPPTSVPVIVREYRKEHFLI